MGTIKLLATWAVLGSIFLVPHVECDLFNFHFVQTMQNLSESEGICQKFGYDGLAIVSSPEAYNYLLKISQFWRFVLSVSKILCANK